MTLSLKKHSMIESIDITGHVDYDNLKKQIPSIRNFQLKKWKKGDSVIIVTISSHINSRIVKITKNTINKADNIEGYVVLYNGKKFGTDGVKCWLDDRGRKHYHRRELLDENIEYMVSESNWNKLIKLKNKAIKLEVSWWNLI